MDKEMIIKELTKKLDLLKAQLELSEEFIPQTYQLEYYKLKAELEQKLYHGN